MTSPRLLVIPGLNDSGPAHWQSWLQSHHRDSVRVMQRDWVAPDLDRWAASVGRTLSRASGHSWIAVAHSFGCLALLRHLQLDPQTPIRAALLVAPAEPDKFGVAELLPQQPIGVPTTLIASCNDPWMSLESTRRWARRWGCRWGCHHLDLGLAGHINTESGFGPLPLARHWVLTLQQRLARELRPQRADFAEWSFAV